MLLSAPGSFPVSSLGNSANNVNESSGQSGHHKICWKLRLGLLAKAKIPTKKVRECSTNFRARHASYNVLAILPTASYCTNILVNVHGASQPSGLQRVVLVHNSSRPYNESCRNCQPPQASKLFILDELPSQQLFLLCCSCVTYLICVPL